MPIFISIYVQNFSQKELEILFFGINLGWEYFWHPLEIVMVSSLGFKFLLSFYDTFPPYTKFCPSAHYFHIIKIPLNYLYIYAYLHLWSWTLWNYSYLTAFDLWKKFFHMVEPNKIWTLVKCLYLLICKLCGTFCFTTAGKMKVLTLITSSYAALQNCLLTSGEFHETI